MNKVFKKVIVLLVAAICISPVFYQGGERASAQAIGTSAASMVTLETSTNRILYAKDADRKRPMASTTKVVTAITVIELTENLEKRIKVPKQAVGVEGSSIYLQLNEDVSIKDLLYGLMLQSGNDCAVALAHAVSGGVKEFAEEMNKMAIKAGAKNSNFVNPHGLHHDDHYTTAKDLALISSYAMKNETFKEIVGTKQYSMPWEGRDYNRIIVNKNKILSTFDGGNGIKTGFTKKAGRCLVSSAEREGMQVVTVVLNCGPMFEDCRVIMDSALKEYVMTDIICRETELVKVPVVRGKQNEVGCGVLDESLYPLAAGEKDKIRLEFDAVNSLSAPVTYCTEAGIVRAYIDNQLIFETKLYTIEEVKPLSIADYLKDLVERWNE